MNPRLSFCLSFLPCSAGWLLAQAAPSPVPFEALLPVETYAVARFGGLAAAKEAMQALPMAKLLDEFVAGLPADTRQTRVEDGLDRAAAELRREVVNLGLQPGDVHALLSRPMALACGRLTFDGIGPSVALLVDVGPHREAIERCLSVLQQMLPFAGPQPEFAGPEWQGAAIRQLSGGEGMPTVYAAQLGAAGQGLPAVYAAYAGLRGGQVVVTNSRGYLRDILAVAAGRAPALASLPVPTQVATMLPAQALAALFLNTRSLVRMFEPHLPYEAQDYADALGLGALDGLYLGSTATAAGGCDAAYLAVSGSRAGLFKAMVGQPVDLGLAALCSSSTVAFGATSFDLPATIDALGRLAELMPAGTGRSLRRQLLDQLTVQLEPMGMTPAELDQMVRSFGNQIGFALSLEKGPIPKPELLLRVVVREAAQVANLLPQLESMAEMALGVEWKSRQLDGMEIRYCNVPLGDNLQLSPCYVLRSGDLLFGSDVQGLVRALRQSQRPGEGLMAQPDFAVLRAEAEGASGVLHLRWFRAADLGWRSVEQFAFPWIDDHQEELGFGSDALPDAEAMAAALGTTTVGFRVDDQGFLVRGRGSLTFGSLLAGGLAVVDVVLGRAARVQ
jgi:hypothetical protein